MIWHVPSPAWSARSRMAPRNSRSFSPPVPWSTWSRDSSNWLKRFSVDVLCEDGRILQKQISLFLLVTSTFCSFSSSIHFEGWPLICQMQPYVVFWITVSRSWGVVIVNISLYHVEGTIWWQLVLLWHQFAMQVSRCFRQRFGARPSLLFGSWSSWFCGNQAKNYYPGTWDGEIMETDGYGCFIYVYVPFTCFYCT